MERVVTFEDTAVDRARFELLYEALLHDKVNPKTGQIERRSTGDARMLGRLLDTVHSAAVVKMQAYDELTDAQLEAGEGPQSYKFRTTGDEVYTVPPGGLVLTIGMREYDRWKAHIECMLEDDRVGRLSKLVDAEEFFLGAATVDPKRATEEP